MSAAPVAGTGNLTELSLSAAPRRVVSLVPSVTGSLFDLGLVHILQQGHAVVRRHFFEQGREVRLVESSDQLDLPGQAHEFENFDAAAQIDVR